MSAFAPFFEGVGVGLLAGVIVGDALRRSAAGVVAGGGRVGMMLSGARRMVVLCAAFWVGSRFGAAGLVGTAVGTLAGIAAIVLLAVREPSRG